MKNLGGYMASGWARATGSRAYNGGLGTSPCLGPGRSWKLFTRATLC